MKSLVEYLTEAHMVDAVDIPGKEDIVVVVYDRKENAMKVDQAFTDKMIEKHGARTFEFAQAMFKEYRDAEYINIERITNNGENKILAQCTRDDMEAGFQEWI